MMAMFGFPSTKANMIVRSMVGLPSTLAVRLALSFEAEAYQSNRYCGPFPLLLRSDRVMQMGLIKQPRLHRILSALSAGRQRSRSVSMQIARR
jgi:hypothetical protein